VESGGQGSNMQGNLRDKACGCQGISVVKIVQCFSENQNGAKKHGEDGKER
jgi:hypothetical protein